MMRSLFAFVFLLYSTSSSFALVCPTKTQESGFNLIELRNQAMIIAVTCQKQTEYNRFVTRFRPALQRANKQMFAYFHTRHPRLTYDQYMTQLANHHSQIALKEGNEFCDNQKFFMQKVAELKTSKDLLQTSDKYLRVRSIDILACTP